MTRVALSTLRTAQLSDLDALIELHVQLFEHDLTIDPNLNTQWPNSDQGRKFLIDNITSENALVLLAVDHERPVGYLIGMVHHNDLTSRALQGEVRQLFVDADHRSGGIGRKLVKSFSDWAASEGVQNIVLSAYFGADSNTFYEALGFKPLGIRYAIETRDLLGSTGAELP